jgi:molybdopterin-guanine dinucleotide biosynthesis protein A
MRVAVVVLAGGAARRWGGRDKTAALLGSRTVLEHAAEGLRWGVRTWLAPGAGDDRPDAEEPRVPVIVAGPADQAGRPGLEGVRWVREDPAGGGPVSGLAAAVHVLPAEVDVVVVGAGDAPFGGSAIPRLLAALVRGGHDGRGNGEECDHRGDDRDESAVGGEHPKGRPVDASVGVDRSGRRQPLLAVYRLAALRAALAALGDPAGIPLRAVVDRLCVTEVPVTAREALDLDTPAAFDEAARQLSRGATGVPGSGPAS